MKDLFRSNFKADHLGRRQALLPILASLAIGFTSLAAQAADPAFCNTYANQAVAQQRENLASGCGFQSLRWTDNAPAAYLYCMSFGESTASSETAFRDQKLAQCRADKAADAGNDDGPVVQMEILEPEITQQAGGQGAGGSDGIAAMVSVITAGTPGGAGGCKPSIRSGLYGNTRSEAMQNARAGWEDSASFQHGAVFGDFDLAREAQYECRIEGGSHYCVAVGRACSPVRLIEGNPEPDAGDLRVVEQGVEKTCLADQHEVVRLYDGDKRQIFYSWVKTQWEYEVAQQFGSEFARIDNASSPLVSCTAMSVLADHDWYCRARGTPCSDPAKATPTCYPVYRYYTDMISDPKSYNQLWAEWSGRVETLYGPGYRSVNAAIDRNSGEYTPGTNNFERRIRFVEARACR